MIDLLPCPFCGSQQGSDAGPEIQERNRVNQMTRNKLGKPHRRITITHLVWCTNCGAEGPTTMFDHAHRDAPQLTPEIIEHSEQAAALEWNRRQPIDERAYELVSRIITSTLASLSESSTNSESTSKSGKKSK